jgi:murein DD-endopeptidase MepM/ murein hydrolase activator NlpD
MTFSGSVAADIEYLRSRAVLMPVAGATMSKVEDTFSEPRDGGRVHRAIDIMAPRGTPVLSADAGRVLRMSTTGIGGIAMFAADADGRIVYYYAHMDRYHESMAEGRPLAKGDTIGFVGTTGNAPKNTPHLHFQVMRMSPDGRFWDGEPINPYELLIDSERAKLATHP